MTRTVANGTSRRASCTSQNSSELARTRSGSLSHVLLGNTNSSTSPQDAQPGATKGISLRHYQLLLSA